MVIAALTKMPALPFFPMDEGVCTKSKNILDEGGVSSDILKLSPLIKIFHPYSLHEKFCSEELTRKMPHPNSPALGSLASPAPACISFFYLLLQDCPFLTTPRSR